MYGWERRGGAFTDHFAESITDEDVRKALERTRRALIPDAIPNESGRGSVAPSETERTRAIAPATGDDAPDASSAVSDDPDAASDDRDASREPAKTPRADQTTPWAEHKRAGAESFQRGAFRDAADRFARAARALAADAERNTTETRVDAVTLAGLHSNVSAALLRAGDSAGAAEAAERCVAARPEWGKAHFRVGEAAFAAARFDAAREAYGRARECAENDAASGAHDGSVPNSDVAILERRIAACARAARGAAMCDEEESSLAAAAEARRLEAERKREASSDENVARLNAEAEDRERDPNARRLMREIEALFAEARKTTEETRDAAGPDPAAPAAPAASGEKEKQEARKRTPSPRAAPKKNAFPARAALRLLAELLSVEPENFEAAFQAAILSLRENRTLDAIAYARRCLARAPGFARAADFLATCLETTQEGGDRSRGDDAHRARVRVSTESGPAGPQLAPAPSESEAELALAMAVMSNPESPDAWTAFARHLARRGLASDAVAALRDALAGGPEGKWLRPRSDAALLTTLGFMLHLRGHVAEPASLYASAAAHGGGMVTATLAARVAGGDDDDAVSRARDAMRAAFSARAPETAPHLEALNVAFAAPQFEVAARKYVVAALLSDAGVEDVAPPTLCWARGTGAQGEPRSAGPARDWRLHCGEETLFAGGRAAWLLKARRRAFEGAVRVSPARACPRVFACGSEAEALQRLANAGVGPATATAQRYVSASAPATRAGRGVTLRLFATLVGPDAEREANLAATRKEGVHGTASATERESVFFSPQLAEGFVIRAAPRWLDARDDDDADGDRDDADGDCTQTDDEEDFVVDVASAAEAETWANAETVGFGFVDAGAASDDARRPMDWARAYASARRKAETYFRLADGTAWRERHGEMDARAAWRRARLPKLVETAFALDGDGEPWLVDVEPFPPLVRYASVARDGIGVALRHLARAHDLCD